MSRFRSLGAIAFLVTALLAFPALAGAEQLSAEDQYVDTGPLGNGPDELLGDQDPDPAATPGTAPADAGVLPAAGEPAATGEPQAKAKPENETGNGESRGGVLPVAGIPSTPAINLTLIGLLVVLGLAGVARLLKRAGEPATE